MARKKASGRLTKLTKEQAAILGAFTGIACGPFSDIHEYCERIMGHPIFTHQFPALAEKIKEAAREDFLAICYGKD